MTKDEMKNRISLALKDPILQQGFEVICKDLADLEKQLAISEHDREHNDYELTEVYKKITDLEKENAELVQEKYNLEYKIENLENKIEHHQEVIDTFKKINAYLEKENAELKKENAVLKGVANSVLDNWCKGNDPCPHLKKRDDQLTKAKEIIKKLYSHVFQGMGFMELNDFNVQKAETEQFLSEVEK